MIKKIKLYEWLLIIAAFIIVSTSYSKMFVTGVFKIFVFEGQKYEYKYWELVWLEGQYLFLICALGALYFIIPSGIGKKITQWFIDLFVIDMYFTYTKNPYDFDSYTTLCYVAATVMFFIILLLGDYFIPFVKRKK